MESTLINRTIKPVFDKLGFELVVLSGGMCEWLKQAVLKTAVRETVPGVRIPLPPPFKYMFR